jgi:uncharacterized membrane protein HdeD (DUF308 family)
MMRLFVDNWWLLILRGIFALAFGMFVFSAQTLELSWLLRALALASMVELFGLFAFCAGIFTIVAAARGLGKERDWWLLLLDGVGACIAGVTAMIFPGLTFLALVRIIGVWALFVGVCELFMARKLRRHLPDEWFLVSAACGSLAFGAFLFGQWISQIHQLFLWLAFYAVFSGCAMLALGLRLGKLRGLAHLAAMHAASPHLP